MRAPALQSVRARQHQERTSIVMGENLVSPPAVTDPTWVGLARRRKEPTPAYDAYRKLSTPSPLDPDLIAQWAARLAVPVPPGRPLPAVSVKALLDEVDRLNTVLLAVAPVLDRAVLAEGCRWESELRYPLVKLADDTFIAWAGSCDAPTGWVMTEAQALQRGWSPARIAKAEAPNPDGQFYNRAGPQEKTLTVAAILSAYTDGDAHDAFRLTPATVQCTTTSDMRQDPKTKEWESGPVYWDPWAPDAVPEQLPDGWADRY